MATDTADCINQFVAKLGLSAESQKLLESQEQTVQMDLMTSFIPREGTRDVNSLFGSFVRSRASRRALSVCPQTTPAPAHNTSFHDFNADDAARPATTLPAGDSEEVQAFVSRFRLDQHSLQMIQNMTPDVQRDVISSFHPQDATRDVNKLFQSFCRSRATGRFPGSAAAAGIVIHEKQAHHVCFFNTYGLNDVSQNALLALPLELQAEILVSFRPKDSTRDANSLFLAFVKSRTQNRFPELSAVLNHAAPMNTVSSTFYPTNSNPVPQMQMAQMSRMGYPPYASYGGVVDPAWSVSSASGYTVEQFAQVWKLSRVCVNCLHIIPLHVQSDVMQNFYPQDQSQDTNSLFLSFAKSRMQAYGVDDSVLSFGVAVGGKEVSREQAEFALKHGLPQDTLDQMSAPMQEKMIADFASTGTSQDAGSQFVDFMRSRITSTFIDIFQLNSESIDIFHGLDANIRSDVVKNFDPNASFRDMNTQFHEYVRSSIRMQQRGIKRSLDAPNENIRSAGK